jgi:hypothetical protein
MSSGKSISQINSCQEEDKFCLSSVWVKKACQSGRIHASGQFQFHFDNRIRFQNKITGTLQAPIYIRDLEGNRPVPTIAGYLAVHRYRQLML